MNATSLSKQSIQRLSKKTSKQASFRRSLSASGAFSLFHLTKSLDPVVSKPTTTTCAAFSTMAPSSTSTKTLIRVIPRDRLYVSEPNPAWFGNGPNPKNDKTWTNGNWLKSRFHFSFAEYNNPQNENFGVLRVMNDDLVQPRRGFGTHPHSNMEIITYIVEGELTHQDSMGTKESLGRGSIQFMTSGRGVQHSEFNNGGKPLRFIQTWIVPNQRGLKPNYGSFRGDNMNKNALHHLVSDVNDGATLTPVSIHQDLNAYAVELEAGKSFTFDVKKGRQIYLICLEGSITVDGKAMTRHDGCEIHASSDAPTSTMEIKVTGTERTECGDLAHILFFEMKQVVGEGRGDL